MAADESIEWHEGKKELRANEVEIAPPPEFSSSEINEIRKELHMSQPVFAGIFGYSADAVKAWEQGNKTPNAAARRLLQFLLVRRELVNQIMKPA